MKTVFKQPRYLLLLVIFSLAFLVLSIWLPNLDFVKDTFFSSTLTFDQKTGILLSSLGAIKTNFTLLSRILALVTALFFGINFSLLIYYLKLRFESAKAIGSGLGGVFAAVLGSGCVSCGSVILTSLLGVSTTVSLVYALPLRGYEFGIASLVILGSSIILLAQKVNRPTSCEIIMPHRRGS
ncbi:MAG TPA: hypothetical protein VI791_00935 [Patescibacteria group bacterium]|nr:hypothetical protein [Patescibacteria group bacterium]